MRQAGMHRVTEGLTTPYEVMRVRIQPGLMEPM